MQNRIIFFFLTVFFLGTFPVFGINFSSLNLSGDDRLLFRANIESQQTLYISRLADMSIQQLTAFPQRLELVDNGRSIIAASRFGAVRVPTSGGLPSVLPGYPSFAAGNIPLAGRMEDFAASSDGRWILYVEPTSPAYGDLLLINTLNGTRWKITERIELPSTDFPARWSRDSRLFVYSKGGRLFYFPIIQDLSVIINERFRQIGAGGITSVSWGNHGDFYYFFENTLYRVVNPELFTRTIYGDFLSIGNVVASFPFDFEPDFDRYWISPDSGSVLINKRDKNLFLFMLDDNQGSAASTTAILPHIRIPQGACYINVYWASAELLTVMFSLQNETIIWRFNINGRAISTSQLVNIPFSSNGALSPGGTRILFWGEKGLELWDYAAWQLIHRISDEPVFSCVWVNNNEFIAGNSRFIESINISGSAITRRIVTLSGADESGYEETVRRGPERILARAGSDWFITDGRAGWMPVNNPQVRNVSLASDRFRVYLENQSSGPFGNIPMIRNMASFGTTSLVSNHRVNTAFPQRQRKIPVALCFDLYDDDTGLSQVLIALNRFNIKATFFVNGDFIRRNPIAATAIVEAGHEAASLFFAPIDLSDARYVVTPEFIAQGLARNEDEFFRATGRELSLLWHPPFYRSSDFVRAAGAAAGYTIANRNIDPGDWLPRDEALRLGIHQLSSSEMIERIIEQAASGAVIPVRLGLITGGRNEYLFNRIDVLLDALLRTGAEIVPVSAVVGR